LRSLQISDFNYYLTQNANNAVAKSIKVKFKKLNKESTTKTANSETQRPGDPVSVMPEMYYYHSDHLGTGTFLTDFGGIPYQFFLNLPFGETLIEQHSYSGDYTNRYKFNGKELDEETGFYYYGARYYNPKFSLMLSVDQMMEKYPGMNPYAYCFQNPINLIDPTGMEPEEGCGDTNPPKYQWYRFRSGDSLQYSFLPYNTVRNGVKGEVISGGRVVYGATGNSNVQLNPDGTFVIDPPTQNPVKGHVSWNAKLANGGSFEIQAVDYPHPKGVGMDMVDAIPMFLTGLAAERLLVKGLGGLFIGQAATKAAPTSTALTNFYPKNNGFLGASQETFLMPGQQISRYGLETGRFFSPSGTTLPMRALPTGTNTSLLNTYTIMKPFPVQSGTIAPAFGQPGLGIQHMSNVSAEVLLKRGIIK
jgi:RHS repeat-associated protein